MIYFIVMSETDFVKIGYSESPSGRMRHLQTAHPHDLKILARVSGTMKMERALHRHFKNRHVRGEWFRLSGDVQSLIDKLCRGLNADKAIGVERLLESTREIGLDLSGYLE